VSLSSFTANSIMLTRKKPFGSMGKNFPCVIAVSGSNEVQPDILRNLIAIALREPTRLVQD
jgi:hypothetical protein